MAPGLLALSLLLASSTHAAEAPTDGGGDLSVTVTVPEVHSESEACAQALRTFDSVAEDS